MKIALFGAGRMGRTIAHMIKKLGNHSIHSWDEHAELIPECDGHTSGNIKDLNKIKPGQKINIPAKVPKRKSVYQGMSKSEMKKIDKSKKRYSGKIVKRKKGGQVMSGNDLVSSLYD